MPPLGWPKVGQSSGSDAGHAPLRTSNRGLLALSDRGYVDLETRFFRKTWSLRHCQTSEVFEGDFAAKSAEYSQ